jgi:GTP cyclohydrolase II
MSQPLRRAAPVLSTELMLRFDQSGTLSSFEERLKRAELDERAERPFVTLTFAQSIDGSIARAQDAATALSNPRALTVTHLLRARHDAILVGIGTVIADDPRLTVRLVDGPSPQAVVLDTRLRFPLRARLLRDGCRPLIATTRGPCPPAARLEAAGASVVRVRADESGLVDLFPLLNRLRRAGVRSLMVEGGARVITSFLRANLADHLVLTIAPLFLGGLRAVNPLSRLDIGLLPELRDIEHTALGDNLLLTASLHRDD